MSNTAIPIERRNKTAATEQRLDVLGELGFPKNASDVNGVNLQVAYNQKERRFYLLIWDSEETDTLYLYREKDAFRNDWEQVGTHSITDPASFNIRNPIVTSQNTLMFGMGTEGIGRAEQPDDDDAEDNWGDSFEIIQPAGNGVSPLQFKHGEDARGNIFFGVYDPNQDFDIYKSTDDGETWDIIGSFNPDNPGSNAHVHGVAASQHSDLIAAIIGHVDDNDTFGLMRKDGSDASLHRPIRGGSGQYEPVPIMDLRNDGSPDEASDTFITGNDSTEVHPVLARNHVSIGGDGSGTLNLDYGVASFESTPRIDWIHDFDYAGGHIVALADRGRSILFSPDGWFWGRKRLNMDTRHQIFTQGMAVGERHIACYANDVYLLPIDSIRNEPVRSTSYSTFDGTQDTAQHSGRQTLMRLNLTDAKTARILAHSEADGEIWLRKRPDQYESGAGTDETVIDFGTGGGTEWAEVDLHGTPRASLKWEDATDGDRYTVVLERY